MLHSKILNNNVNFILNVYIVIIIIIILYNLNNYIIHLKLYMYYIFL